MLYRLRLTFKMPPYYYARKSKGKWVLDEREATFFDTKHEAKAAKLEVKALHPQGSILIQRIGQGGWDKRARRSHPLVKELNKLFGGG